MVSGAPFNSSGACSCGAPCEYWIYQQMVQSMQTIKWHQVTITPCFLIRPFTIPRKAHAGWGAFNIWFGLMKMLLLIPQSPPTNLHSGWIVHSGFVFVRSFTKQSLFRWYRSFTIQGYVSAGPCPASNLQARDQLSQHRCGPCSHGPAHTAAACPQAVLLLHSIERFSQLQGAKHKSNSRWIEMI